MIHISMSGVLMMKATHKECGRIFASSIE